jgi:hypothetical protein
VELNTILKDLSDPAFFGHNVHEEITKRTTDFLNLPVVISRNERRRMNTQKILFSLTAMDSYRDHRQLRVRRMTDFKFFCTSC